jgi:hypothetical protein
METTIVCNGSDGFDQENAPIDEEILLLDREILSLVGGGDEGSGVIRMPQ